MAATEPSDTDSPMGGTLMALGAQDAEVARNARRDWRGAAAKPCCCCCWWCWAR